MINYKSGRGTKKEVGGEGGRGFETESSIHSFTEGKGVEWEYFFFLGGGRGLAPKLKLVMENSNMLAS